MTREVCERCSMTLPEHEEHCGLNWTWRDEALWQKAQADRAAAGVREALTYYGKSDEFIDDVIERALAVTDGHGSPPRRTP